MFIYNIYDPHMCKKKNFHQRLQISGSEGFHLHIQVLAGKMHSQYDLSTIIALELAFLYP